MERGAEKPLLAGDKSLEALRHPVHCRAKLAKFVAAWNADPHIKLSLGNPLSRARDLTKRVSHSTDKWKPKKDRKQQCAQNANDQRFGIKEKATAIKVFRDD